jgi:ELWxxDGT repeat protein
VVKTVGVLALMAWMCFLVTFGCRPAQAGTPHLVRDINAQYVSVSSFPGDFADQGAWSFFDANDGIHGSQPWLTNGTAAGTFLWADVSAPGTGVTGLQPLFAGGHSFILYQDPGTQTTTVWVSDGTPSGSHSLATFTPTSAGVNAGLLGSYGNLAALTFYNLSTGNRDLWLSDGTAAGTQRVQSASGAAFSVGSTVFVNGKIYFMSGPGSTPDELWESDGTSAGTGRLAQIPDAVQDPVFGSTLAVVGHYLLFNANTTASGRELWSFDLSTNTLSQLADIAPGTASGLSSGTFWRVGGVVLFTASVTGDTNVTLWRSDGTSAGTYSIASATPATGFQSFTANANSPVGLFQIVTAGGGEQLWGTDGTAAGTQLLCATSGGYPVNQIGGHFYFWTFTSQVAQLWTTDGTTAGTHVLNGLPGVPANNTPQMTGTADTIYVRFRNGGTSGASIIRYDLSTSTSTLLATDPMTTSPLYVIGVFAYAQGRLYFDNEDPIHGRELWTSDGTVAGTLLLENVAQETQTQPSSPADFVAFNSRLYFTADDGVSGREVWYSDGTDAGTSELKDINPGLPSSTPSDLFVANGTLYFFAVDATGVSHLWRSDGTTGGTQPLGAVAARPANERNRTGCDSKGVAMGGNVYFAGYDSVNGTQLWKTDGTAAGTIIVSNAAAPFAGPLLPCYLAATSNRVFFQGTPAYGATGTELWASDGTTAGTTQIADINPGIATPSFSRMMEHTARSSGAQTGQQQELAPPSRWTPACPRPCRRLSRGDSL